MSRTFWSRWLKSTGQQKLAKGIKSPRRKSERRVEVLEDRTVPADFTWTGGDLINDNWNDSDNWSFTGVDLGADLIRQRTLTQFARIL